MRGRDQFQPTTGCNCNWEWLQHCVGWNCNCVGLAVTETVIDPMKPKQSEEEEAIKA